MQLNQHSSLAVCVFPAAYVVVVVALSSPGLWHCLCGCLLLLVAGATMECGVISCLS